METGLEIVKEIISCYCDEEIITEKTNLLRDLEINSLDLMNILCDIEDRFKVVIPESMLGQFVTVKDILNFIEYPWYSGMCFKNVRDLLQQQAIKIGNSAAILDWETEISKKEVTYCELYNQVLYLGTYLYHQDIRNKKIALMGENSFEFILLFLTCASGNNTIIPIAPSASEQEIREILEDCDADILFYSESQKIKAYIQDVVSWTICLDEIQEMILIGQAIMDSGESLFLNEDFIQNQEMLIMYTSGTTGKKKGAVLTQEAIAWNIYHTMEVYQCNGRVLSLLPYHHIFGLVDGILFVLASGTTICVGHSMKNMFELLRIYQPNWCYMVPMFAESIQKRIKSSKSVESVLGENFEGIICGGAKLKTETLRYFENIKIPILCGYGMTETCPVIAVNRNKKVKPESAGRIIEGLEVRIDENSEVLVKADHIMKEYYKNQEETNKVIQDGWFHTGDAGYIDEEQYLFLTGRLKNLIILSNGENVSAEMLEQKVYSCKGVKECIVTEKDNKITAILVPDHSYLLEHKISPSQALEFFESKMESWNLGLPTYQWIQKIIVQEAPFERTESGKIKRNEGI